MSPAIRAGAPLRARILALAVLTALLATALALGAPHGAQAATTPTYAQMMQRVIDDTNAVRAQAGLRPLVRNADLDRVAADWALRQWQNSTMSHNPNFSTQIPSGWQRAGENVAMGYTYLQVVPAWKASPGHYANIVNDYTSIGIGYFEQGGHRYWCQLFAKYPGVTLPALVEPTTLPDRIPVPTHSRTTSPRISRSSTPTVASVPGPIAPAGVALAVNAGSFESGLGSWSAPASTIDGPNSNARSGVRSLLVLGAPGRMVTQTVSTSVAAGSTHALTVWVRADSAAAGSVRLRTVGGSADEWHEVPFTASSSGWARVSVTLTAQVAHTGFRLDILTPGAGHTYRIDAVSLVRTFESPTEAAPSSAWTGSIPVPSAPSDSLRVFDLLAPRIDGTE